MSTVTKKRGAGSREQGKKNPPSLVKAVDDLRAIIDDFLRLAHAETNDPTQDATETLNHLMEWIENSPKRTGANANVRMCRLKNPDQPGRNHPVSTVIRSRKQGAGSRERKSRHR